MNKYIPNSFQIANALIDDFFQYLTGNDFKCYCYIARKTIGWQKQAEYISIADIKENCNIAKQSTIDCVKRLEKLGLICVQRKKSENGYKINKITLNLQPKIDEKLIEEFLQGSLKNGQGGSPKFGQGSLKFGQGGSPKFGQGSLKFGQGGSPKFGQGLSNEKTTPTPEKLNGQGLQDHVNTLYDIGKPISLNPTETKVSTETLFSDGKPTDRETQQVTAPQNSPPENGTIAPQQSCVASDVGQSEILPDEKLSAESKSLPESKANALQANALQATDNVGKNAYTTEDVDNVSENSNHTTEDADGVNENSHPTQNQKIDSKPSNLPTDCKTTYDLYQDIPREEKRNLKANESVSNEFALMPCEHTPQKVEGEVLDKQKTLREKTWQFYEQAYIERYNIKPFRNAKVNSQVKQFVERVGEDAPKIAYFYVFHCNSWYIRKAHDFGLLLSDAQAVARDFYRGQQTTNTTAKWEEEAATAHSAAEEAKRLLRMQWAEEDRLKAEQERAKQEQRDA